MLKIGIVGCGEVYKSAHKQAWQALEIEGKVKVVACCDINYKLAKEATEGFDAKSYTDIDQMLKNE